MALRSSPSRTTPSALSPRAGARRHYRAHRRERRARAPEAQPAQSAQDSPFQRMVEESEGTAQSAAAAAPPPPEDKKRGKGGKPRLARAALLGVVAALLLLGLLIALAFAFQAQAVRVFPQSAVLFDLVKAPPGYDSLTLDRIEAVTLPEGQLRITGRLINLSPESVDPPYIAVQSATPAEEGAPPAPVVYIDLARPVLDGESETAFSAVFPAALLGEGLEDLNFYYTPRAQAGRVFRSGGETGEAGAGAPHEGPGHDGADHAPAG